MRPRRGATDLAGVLLVDKPAGLTSHDVVAEIRSATGERRIGHTGTLDPMATGLLVVLVGRATRLERYLVGHDKRYQARIVFGSATDTLDAEGTVVERCDVPATIADEAFATKMLSTFLGAQDQVPPAYSAIKRHGVAAHRLARAGQSPTLEARAVEVFDATLLGIDEKRHAWDVSFAVSKGTYIRSLADDIGRAADTCAHLGALRRTKAGAADLADAIPLEEAIALAEDGRLDEHFTDAVTMLRMPAVEVAPDATADGKAVTVEGLTVAEGERAVLVTADEVLGVYVRQGDTLVPETVLSPGVPR